MNKNLEISELDRKYLRLACDIASENIDKGGGPFGAVIVKDGRLISTGGDTVAIDNDPTAHAEINAIRRACSQMSDFKLEGCVVYSSCEPCPMCLSALHLAGVSRIYYANTKHDFSEICKSYVERSIPCVHIDDPHTIDHFN